MPTLINEKTSNNPYFKTLAWQIEKRVPILLKLAFENEKVLNADDFDTLKKQAFILNELRKYCTDKAPSNFDEISNKEYEEWKSNADLSKLAN